ncbi:MAG: hypothetical protein KGQ52_00755 [Alphaproteobacteria bacterium]|nr:hypothetical protein [Alphaproteobacteria bacterium]
MNDPFDRGEINEASLAATERLRARLMGQPATPAPGAARRSLLPWAVAAAVLAFAAGLIANPWFEQAVRGRLPFAAATQPDQPALEQRLAALEKRAPSAPVVAAERLARTEARVESSTDQLQRDAQRIDALAGQLADLAARLAAQEARDTSLITTAQGAANRAEAMLTVLLLRRALADGRPIDALLPAASRLFEAGDGDAVAALAALAAKPVTRAGLARELGVLADTSDVRPNWWQALMARLDDAMSGAAAQGPVAAARAAMVRGDVAAATARLRAAPALAGNAMVRGWLANAERLLAAEAALARLEAAATTPIAPPVAAPPLPAGTRR